MLLVILGNQLQYLDNRVPDEVWLTHAHIGHIDGLGLFGREAMNVKGAKLHVSKRMLELITQTPHWQIMIEQGVFSIDEINNGESKQKQDSLSRQFSFRTEANYQIRMHLSFGERINRFYTYPITIPGMKLCRYME